MNNSVMWAGIVGFFAPVVLQFIQQESWSRKVQAVVAFLFCLVVTVPTVYLAHPGDLSATDYVKSALVVLVATIAFYKGFWNPAGVTPTNHAEATGRG